MALELELKYLITPQAALHLAEVLPACGQVIAAQQQDLFNAYYDTPQLWFRQHDMGLRTRRRHSQFEQTIKLAGKQHGALQIRPEYNLPCLSARPELNAFAADLWPENADVAMLQSNLIELFRTDFSRHSWQLQTNHARLEVVYDQGWIEAGEHRQAISEIELELLDGDANSVFAVAEQLLAVLPLQAGWLSKAARGYQLFWQRGTSTPKPIAANLSGAALLQATLQGLQQLENCYQQQHDPVLLQQAGDWAAALATTLATMGLPELAQQAGDLAALLTAQQAIFASKAYQQLLLALSKLLFTL